MPSILSSEIKSAIYGSVCTEPKISDVSFGSNIDDEDDYDSFEKKSDETNIVDEEDDSDNDTEINKNKVSKNGNSDNKKGEVSVADTIYKAIKNFVVDKYNYGKKQFLKFWDKTYGKIITVLSVFVTFSSVIGARSIVKKNKMIRKSLKEIFSGESIDAISDNAEDIVEKITETVKNALTFNLKELSKTPSHVKDIIKSASKMLAEIFYKGGKKLEEGAEEVLDVTDPVQLLAQTVKQQQKMIDTLLEHVKGNKENSEALLDKVEDLQKTLTPEAVASMDSVELLDKLNKQAYALLKRNNPDVEPSCEQINKLVSDILEDVKKRSGKSGKK